MEALRDLQAMPMAMRSLTIALVSSAVALSTGLFFWLINRHIHEQRRRGSPLPSVPEVPGLPIIGNLLQLREGKPHVTFVRWALTYGPIFSIKAGSQTIIVLNNHHVAKEAMVTRFSSISTRKLSKALSILSFDKCMVATSDYGNFHRTMKRHILTNVLGSNAQAVGSDVQSIYVEELGRILSKHEIFRILVKDPVECLVQIDFRDFFPYLKWIPNWKFETKLEKVDFRRHAVMKALVKEQSKRVVSGEVMNCYLGYLLTEEKTLTEKQIGVLLWEVIIGSLDSTFLTSEWILFELAKSLKTQDRLYQEIQSVCGSDKITEEKLCRLPQLQAVFHETLRRHSPFPLSLKRFALEDTEIGGYYVPAGSEIVVNFYGCNMDENQWEKPEEWKPERFLDKMYNQNDLHKTMAFGRGKRVCPGALQAMLIACTAIGRLVQEFEWRLKDEEEEENRFTFGITNNKLHPLQAIIRPRN